MVKYSRKALAGLALVSVVCLFSGMFESTAFATIAQVKIYKQVFGLDKAPKCNTCHVSEKPKKDEGAELNEYGKKLKSLKETPDEGTYKEAGQAPEKSA